LVETPDTERSYALTRPAWQSIPLLPVKVDDSVNSAVPAVMKAVPPEQQRAQSLPQDRRLLCVVQRFGSALQLAPHFHAALFDGAFRKVADGKLHFVAAPAITSAECHDLRACP
jgi:hypothetical protein